MPSQTSGLPILLALCSILISCLAQSFPMPPEACFATYSGGATKQRSASFVLVPNATFVLQSFPMVASTGQIYLDPGYNYSLHTAQLALESSLPWSNVTATTKIAVYQSPSGSPPGAPITVRNGRFGINKSGTDFWQVFIPLLQYGDVLLDPSMRVWIGVQLNGFPALALSLSKYQSPGPDILALNCSGAAFAALNTSADLPSNGCIDTVSPGMLWVQMKLFVNPCPCGLPAPNNYITCTLVYGGPKWVIDNTATNLTLNGNQTAYVEGPFTIDGIINVPGTNATVAHIETDNCTYIEANSTLVLNSVDLSRKGQTQTILVISSQCVFGTFADVKIDNGDPNCPVTAKQSADVLGFSVILTASPSCSGGAALPRWVLPVAVVSGIVGAAILIGTGAFLFATYGKTKCWLFSSGSGDDDAYTLDLRK